MIVIVLILLSEFLDNEMVLQNENNESENL